MTRLPDFFIVGAAKAGTTSLVHRLTCHPAVFIPELKEPEYFAGPRAPGADEAWYRSLFAEAQSDQLCGDASTSYSMHPTYGANAATKIAATLPDARIIYVVREPVARTVSHYRQTVYEEQRFRGERAVPWSFEEALKRNPALLAASDYVAQLAEYEAVFSREQILVLVFDDLARDQTAVAHDIYTFLGLDPQLERVPSDDIRTNATGAQFERLVIGRVLRPLREIAPLHALRHLFPSRLRSEIYRRLVRSPLASGLRRRHMPPPTRSDTKTELRRRFAPMVAELETVLGRSLPWER